MESHPNGPNPPRLPVNPDASVSKLALLPFTGTVALQSPSSCSGDMEE
jgi:hypothetical protein